MTGDHEDLHYTPRSLWECFHLLSRPLGRDHLLIKGMDKRNLSSYGEIIRGVGTECIKDSQLRTSLATKHIRAYKSEISSRNACVLGDGLIRSLLALETQTDEDGVPLEEEENLITDLVSELSVEIQVKVGCEQLVKLTDQIMGSKEVLMYTKYKLLHSLRKAMAALESRICEEKLHRESLCNIPPPSQSLVSMPTCQSLTCMKSSFIDNLSNSLNGQISNIIRNPINPFTDQILLTEVIATNLVLFNKSQNDLSLIESMIPSLSTFLVQLSDIDENFLRAYLQILVVTPQVLLEVVADQQSLHIVRKAIDSIYNSTSYSNFPKDIHNVLNLIKDSIQS